MAFVTAPSTILSEVTLASFILVVVTASVARSISETVPSPISADVIALSEISKAPILDNVASPLKGTAVGTFALLPTRSFPLGSAANLLWPIAAVVDMSVSVIVSSSISVVSIDGPNSETLVLNAVSATLPGQLMVASLMSDIAAVSLISALVMVPSEISDDSMDKPRSVTLPLSAESATFPAELIVASFVSDMAAVSLISTSEMLPSTIFPESTALSLSMLDEISDTLRLPSVSCTSPVPAISDAILVLSTASSAISTVAMVPSLISLLSMVSSAIFPDVTAFEARLSVVTAPVTI